MAPPMVPGAPDLIYLLSARVTVSSARPCGKREQPRVRIEAFGEARRARHAKAQRAIRAVLTATAGLPQLFN